MKLKRLIGIILSVVLLIESINILTATAFAESSEDSVAYSLDTDTGLLTIYGSGDMDSYTTADSSPWYADRDTIKSVVIGSGVTSVGDYAFYGCTDLGSVVLPDGIEQIGSYAFAGCTGLSYIVLPNSLKSVGDYAFSGTKLALIGVISRSADISSTAFANCYIIKNVYCFEGSTADNSALYSYSQFLSNGVIYYIDEISSSVVDSAKTGEEFTLSLTKESGDLNLTSCEGTVTYDSTMFEYTGLKDTTFISVTDTAVDDETGTGTIAFTYSNPNGTEDTELGGFIFKALKEGSGEINVNVSKIYFSIYTITQGYEGSFEKTFTITVENPAVTSAYFSEETKTLAIGETYDTSLVFEPEFSEAESVAYSSGNTAAAAVDSKGTVTAVKTGTAVITATVDGSIYAYCTITVVDEKSPTEVTDLKADFVGGTAAGFSWSASEDDDEVRGYQIYRDDSYITETAALSYIDSGLIEGTSYKYTVKSVDASGNASTGTDLTLTAKAHYISGISPVTGSEIGGAGTETITVYLSDNGYTYRTGSDSFTLTGEISLNGENFSEISSVSTYDYELGGFEISLDKTNLESGEYTLRFTAADEYGCEAEYEAVYTIDRTAPSMADKDIEVTAGQLCMYISWSGSSESNTAGYRIYRSDSEGGTYELISDTGSTSVKSYTDSGLSEGAVYYYKVSAYDIYNQEGEATAAESATVLGDTDAPVITSFISSKSVLTGEVIITVTAEDNIAVGKIVLQASEDGTNFTDIDSMETSGSAAFTVDSTQYTDGSLWLRAIAYDTYNNSSEETDGMQFTVDNSGPAIASVSGEAASRTITLSFTSEDSDVDYYAVEQKTNDEYSLLGKTTKTSYTVSGLVPEESYDFRICGYDIYGNKGEYYEITCSAAADTTAPQITAISPVSGYYADEISLKFSCKDDYYTEYIVIQISTDNETFENFATVQTGSTSTAATVSYTMDSSEISEGLIYLRAVAYDKAGNSGISDTVSQFNIDHSAPEAPANFAAADGQEEIILTWDYATDATVTGYSVYRSDSAEGEFTLIKTISSRSTISYTDTAVEIGSTYYYKLSQTDRFGREGDKTEAVYATVLADSDIPVILSVTPSNTVDVSSYLTGTATITVTASDNIGVTKIVLQYSVDEGETWTDCGSAENASTASFKFDTTVADSFWIRPLAYDAEENVSSGSLIRKYLADNTPPEKVTGLSLYSAADTSIILTWNDVEADDFSYFRVEESTDGGSSFTKAADVSGNLSCTLTGRSANTTYIYRVKAVDLHGNSGEYSDTLAVSTAVDETIPAITAITPSPKKIKNSVTVYLTAKDNAALSYIEYQVSTDLTDWTAVHRESVSGTSKQVSYTIDASGYDEGSLYVRGVAADTAGNLSDTGSTAPYVEYVIDRTPAEIPEDVAAEANTGYINVSWTGSATGSAASYKVYRSTDGLSFSLYKSVTTINLIDSSVSGGTTYYYCISSVDEVGNESSKSEIASATAVTIVDSEPPKIGAFNYTSGSTVAKSKSISVAVSDDCGLSSVVMEYSQDEVDWTVLDERTSTSTYTSFSFSVSSLSDETYYFRLTANDAAGHTTVSDIYEYTFDSAAPVISGLTAAFEDEKITLTWHSENEDDLAGFYIYRKYAGGSYSKIGTVSNKGTLEYSYTDSASFTTDVVYTYKVTALDSLSNSNSLEVSQTAGEMSDKTAPTAKMSISHSMKVGAEEYFDASSSYDNVGIVSYLWDFGDGTTSSEINPTHAYSEAGVYTVKLTVTDKAGNYGDRTEYVTVSESSGTLSVTVLDDSGNPVESAGVYFNLGSDDVETVYTNASGKVSIKAQAGTYSIGVYKDGYLPAKTEAAIYGDTETSLTMSIEEKEIVVGELTWTRITNIEQILAAGIDIYDAANQYVYECTLTFTYGSQTYSGTGYGTASASSTGSVSPVKLTITDTTSGGGGSSGTQHSSSSTNPPTVYVITPSASEPSKRIIAILDVPLVTSWLKEFFDVELTVYNQADEEFVIDDCEVTLNYPADGLSIAETASDEYEDSASVSIGELPGQDSKTVHWILRGDEAGEYSISADFEGILRDFNEKITAAFNCDEPITVYASEGLGIDIEVEDTVDDGYIFFNAVFKNQSNYGKYLMSFGVPNKDPYDEMYAAIGDDGRAEYNVDNELETSYVDADYIYVEAGMAFRRRYKLTVEEFAAYINPDVDWESDQYAVGSCLYDFYSTSSSDVEIPVEVINLNVSKDITVKGEAVGIADNYGIIGDFAEYTSKYTDGFFRNPSTLYNHAMAKFSLLLTVAGANSSDSLPDDTTDAGVTYYTVENEEFSVIDDEANPEGAERAARVTQNIRATYNNMGFNNENIAIYDYDRDVNKDIIDRAAFSIASKTIITAGEEKTLMVVVVRSAGYGNEWGSNFNVDDPYLTPLGGLSYHFGFNECKEYVVKGVEEYIENNGIDTDNLKIWFAGFSRGAATASGAAAAVTDSETINIDKENVYAYTFATPQGFKESESVLASYDNIFNVLNPCDFIPTLALSYHNWDYGRYGKTLYLPSMLSRENYDYTYFRLFSSLESIRAAEWARAGITETYDYGDDNYMYYNAAQEKSQIFLNEIFYNIFPTDTDFKLVQNELAPILAGFFNHNCEKDTLPNYVEDSVLYDIADYFEGLMDKADGYDIPTADLLGTTLSYYIKTIPDRLFGGEAALMIARLFKIIVTYTDIGWMALSYSSGVLPLAAFFTVKALYAASQIGNLIVYGMRGISTNHMPEMYWAWLNLMDEEELYKDVEYRELRALYATGVEMEMIIDEGETETADTDEYIDIYVYDSEDNLVASVIDGVPDTGDLAAFVNNGELRLYLPSYEDYRIVMESDTVSSQSYSIMDYSNYEVEKVTTFSNCTVGGSDSVTVDLNSSGENYTITNESGESVADVESVYEGDDIEYYTITVEEGEGGTTVYNTYVPISASAVLSAIPDDGYRFAGWYYDGSLLSTETVYNLTNVTEDTTLTAVFEELEVGDVNADGVIDEADGTLILRYLAGTTLFTDTQKRLADYNEDGSVDLRDVTAIIADSKKQNN